LVYDVTNYDSFLDCEEIWFPEIKEFAPQNTIVFLVGNKSDLAHLREVPTAEAAEFAREHQMHFFELSALTYANIDQLFSTLARNIGTDYPSSMSSSTAAPESSKSDTIEDEVSEFILVADAAGGQTVEDPLRDLRGTKQALFPAPIKRFSLHVYFDSVDPAALQAAKDLHSQISLEFPQIKLFPLHMRPVGPHPQPMFEAHLQNRLEFGIIVPWLCLRRGELNVLVRPHSGDLLRDYTTHAIWLGTPHSLLLENLETAAKPISET
jgi:aromatic ring-cleaving dioxygenase